MERIEMFFILCVFSTAYGSFESEKVTIDRVEYVETSGKYHLGNQTALPLEKLFDIFKKPKNQEAILNDYGDNLFIKFRQLLKDEEYDPLEMPEVYENFRYNLIITYHGELALTNGWISDLSTLHRGGDVKVVYSPTLQYMVATIPIGFTNLEFIYDYSAKIMDMGPTGYIKGKVRSLLMEIKIGFDGKNLEMSVLQKKITRVGDIDLTFHGEPLIDWLLDLLVYVATEPLKKVVLLIAEDVIGEKLESAIAAINHILNLI